VPQAAAEVFDPASQMVAITGPLMESRRGHSATLLADGRVVVIGGHHADWDPGSGGPRHRLAAEIYTPAG
jgi:hypothetical protein